MDKRTNESNEGRPLYQRLLPALCFILAVVLQFVGQRHVGYPGLGLQFISLAVLLLLLWKYNRSHR